jgi:hypothetical protein
MQGLWVWRDNAYVTGIGFNISAYGKERPWKRRTNRESWQALAFLIHDKQKSLSKTQVFGRLPTKNDIPHLFFQLVSQDSAHELFQRIIFLDLYGDFLQRFSWFHSICYFVCILWLSGTWWVIHFTVLSVFVLIIVIVWHFFTLGLRLFLFSCK